jgi:hypothetical protein
MGTPLAGSPRSLEEGEHSMKEICEMLGVGRYILYRYLGQRGRNAGEER